MARKATAGEAAAYMAHMAAACGARIVDRTQAIEYEMLRAAVKEVSFGLIDVETYLHNYSVTLGNLVYLSPLHTADPDIMIEVVTHECEHVHQFYDDAAAFTFLYLSEPEARARYEAHAYAAGMEINVARGFGLPSLDQLAFPLEGPAYMLPEEHKKLGRQILEARATQAAAGIYVGKASTEGIKWLKAHAPELLA